MISIELKSIEVNCRSSLVRLVRSPSAVRAVRRPGRPESPESPEPEPDSTPTANAANGQRPAQRPDARPFDFDSRRFILAIGNCDFVFLNTGEDLMIRGSRGFHYLP